MWIAQIKEGSEKSRHPMSQQWTLEPWVSQRAAIETPPKAHSRGVESLTYKIGT